ncbi:MAG: fluoride efflux transporter CrcB [Gammaproteobacteria bacterium]|jgi:CrcB protein|nr:fluoride efflux transporter CrcB [Gammaproteobacteria bacterium]MBT5683503.1 fluoride efflux transporter CrcB [Gammaproteobacteria bacterium]MBT5725776.1 fluoride efflux transporter CrcB [Gammaproteobacteria bacterium]
MGTLTAIALGGALGSVARHGMTVYFDDLLGRDFPYGIFIANIVGSAAIGVLFVLILERGLLSEVWRSLLMVGFLGAFTTFSTFSLQTIGLLQEGRLFAATIYTIGSVLLSITAAYLAIVSTRTLSS